MEKVIRDGHIAILISADYGAGWSTWHWGDNREILIFHPKLVELVESKQHNRENIAVILNELLDKEEVEHIYLGGVENLKVQWLPEGTKFRIEEYDGAEYVITENDLDLIA